MNVKHKIAISTAVVVIVFIIVVALTLDDLGFKLVISHARAPSSAKSITRVVTLDELKDLNGNLNGLLEGYRLRGYKLEGVELTLVKE